MISFSELNIGLVEICYIIIIFIATLLITHFSLPYVIKFMHKKGFIGYDIHKNSRPAVAESGGISLLIGFTVACLLLLLFFPILFNEIIIILITVLVAGGIGFIDDRIKLKSRYKMFLTLISGGIIFLGHYFNFIYIHSPTIPILGKLRLTIIYPLVAPIIVAVFANTVNMLEGYNGEGSGTILIASFFILICAIIWNSVEGLLFSLIVIAILIPFYRYNKFPARIFPGDIGTLSLGAMIACIALFGSLEVVVFCALLIHIFNSFYVISSVKGFFESSEIQEGKNDIILLEDDRIKASDQKDAALTLPRLILARGPLTEPELVKNFYAISIICGFFAIVSVLFMQFTIGFLEPFILIVIIIILLIPTFIIIYYFPRIRGIIFLMIVLLLVGLIFMYYIDIYIIPIKFTYNIDLPIIGTIKVPANLIISFIIAAPGFFVWYYITIKYFWYEINKMKNREN
ncbi:MAG: hypothetical protein ACTSVV_12030 [Promethearchaeota archaeon]